MCARGAHPGSTVVQESRVCFAAHKHLTLLRSQVLSLSPMAVAEELRRLDLDRTKKATMVALCRRLGLPTSGLRAQVEQRLRAYRLRLPPAPTPPQQAPDQRLPPGAAAVLSQAPDGDSPGAPPPPGPSFLQPSQAQGPSPQAAPIPPTPAAPATVPLTPLASQHPPSLSVPVAPGDPLWVISGHIPPTTWAVSVSGVPPLTPHLATTWLPTCPGSEPGRCPTPGGSPNTSGSSQRHCPKCSSTGSGPGPLPCCSTYPQLPPYLHSAGLQPASATNTAVAWASQQAPLPNTPTPGVLYYHPPAPLSTSTHTWYTSAPCHQQLSDGPPQQFHSPNPWQVCGCGSRR